MAKSKFYGKAALSKKKQRPFIDNVQRITWKYKLAEDTVHIEKTANVTEIQIFEIELKLQEIPKAVLQIIDKTIPYQILYRLVHKDNEAWAITLKDNAQAKAYYFTEWNAPITFDFSGLNLEAVYHNLVRAFLKEEAKKLDDFRRQVELDREIKMLETQKERLEKKKEKQFNRKVEMNQRRLELIQILTQLKKQ